MIERSRTSWSLQQCGTSTPAFGRELSNLLHRLVRANSTPTRSTQRRSTCSRRSAPPLDVRQVTRWVMVSSGQSVCRASRRGNTRRLAVAAGTFVRSATPHPVVDRAETPYHFMHRNATTKNVCKHLGRVAAECSGVDILDFRKHWQTQESWRLQVFANWDVPRTQVLT